VRAVAVILALLVVGPAAWTQDEAVRQPLAPGVAAPDFTANTLDGATIKLTDWRGKVVLLNFFVTWYRDAAQHLKMLEDLSTAFSEQGMRLVSSSLDEGQVGLDAVRAVIADQGIAHPVIMDPAQQIAAPYGVRILPAIFIIGRDGVITNYHEGYAEGDDERLGELIAAALQVGAEAEPSTEAQAEAEPAAEPEEPAQPEEPVCKCFRQEAE